MDSMKGENDRLTMEVKRLSQLRSAAARPSSQSPSRLSIPQGRATASSPQRPSTTASQPFFKTNRNGSGRTFIPHLESPKVQDYPRKESAAVYPPPASHPPIHLGSMPVNSSARKRTPSTMSSASSGGNSRHGSVSPVPGKTYQPRRGSVTGQAKSSISPLKSEGLRGANSSFSTFKPAGYAGSGTRTQWKQARPSTTGGMY